MGRRDFVDAVKATTSLTTSQTTKVVGGTADTWGKSGGWAVSHFANATFVVRVKSVCTGCTGRTWNLDWVTVKVTWECPVQGTYPGGTGTCA